MNSSNFSRNKTTSFFINEKTLSDFTDLEIDLLGGHSDKWFLEWISIRHVDRKNETMFKGWYRLIFL